MTSKKPLATPDDIMTSLSKQITKLSAGDRAGLRRIFLTERHEADGVVIGLLHGAGVDIPMIPEIYAPWRLLVHFAALLSGTGTVGGPSHAKLVSLGATLRTVGYSESRLMRLTAARGPALHDQIIRAARTVAQKKRGPVNLWTVFDLAGRDPAKIEKARLCIAHDFYSADAPSKEDSN